MLAGRSRQPWSSSGQSVLLPAFDLRRSVPVVQRHVTGVLRNLTFAQSPREALLVIRVGIQPIGFGDVGPSD